MGFETKNALASPFKAQTTDGSVYADLSLIQLETIGVEVNDAEGKLHDYFITEKSQTDTTLLSVAVAHPSPEIFPSPAPKHFDISARFFPMERNALTFWKELSRWTFAITVNDQIAYFQSLPETSITKEAVREVKLAISQLRMQGVISTIEKVIIWDSLENAEESNKTQSDVLKALGLTIEFQRKPTPELPEKLSEILPADIQLDQRLKNEKKKKTVLAVSLLTIYGGLLAVMFYNSWNLSQKIEALQSNQAASIYEHANINIFYDEWLQLTPVVDQKHWPLTSLTECAAVIQFNQDIRFSVYEATGSRIIIRGDSADIKQTSKYADKLKHSLSDYDWNLPPADPDQKTGRWKFNYEGRLKGFSENSEW